MLPYLCVHAPASCARCYLRLSYEEECRSTAAAVANEHFRHARPLEHFFQVKRTCPLLGGKSIIFKLNDVNNDAVSPDIQDKMDF